MTGPTSRVTPARPEAPTPATTLGVLVCTHTIDRLEQVSAAVSSLAAQDRRPDEVLVVVDGTESLASAVRAVVPDRLPGRLPGTEVEVRVHALGRNQGVSVARTVGVGLMTSAVVAFLDDDAEAEAGWLSGLERPLEDPSVIGSSGRSEALWIGRRPRWLPDEFLWTVGCSYRGMPTEPARVRNVYGGCAAVRRDVFEQVGGYDADLGHGAGRTGGGEEAEFCLRATAATGGTFAFEPSARIRHRVPGERLTWRFYLERCRSEGELKAVLARRSPAGSLGPEVGFARGLPVAVLRALATPGRRAEPAGLVLGAAAVVVGLLQGTGRGLVGGLVGRLRGGLSRGGQSRGELPGGGAR